MFLPDIPKAAEGNRPRVETWRVCGGRRLVIAGQQPVHSFPWMIKSITPLPPPRPGRHQDLSPGETGDPAGMLKQAGLLLDDEEFTAEVAYESAEDFFSRPDGHRRYKICSHNWTPAQQAG